MRRAFLYVAVAALLTACGASGESAAIPLTMPSLTSTAITTTPRHEATATRAQANVRTPYAGVATPLATHYPVGCTPAEVEAFLNRFLSAFNRGDQEALHTFFPTIAADRGYADYTGEKFVWYSMTDQHPDGSKRHFVAYDLPTLWGYFAERHVQHETLHLASVAVGEQDPLNGRMTLNLYRAADDVAPNAGVPPGQAIGKAVMNCRDQTLRVVSLAQWRDPTATPTR